MAAKNIIKISDMGGKNCWLTMVYHNETYWHEKSGGIYPVIKVEQPIGATLVTSSGGPVRCSAMVSISV